MLEVLCIYIANINILTYQCSVRWKSETKDVTMYKYQLQRDTYTCSDNKSWKSDESQS